MKTKILLSSLLLFIVGATYAVPFDTDFSADATTVEEGTSISFTSEVFNATGIISYAWTFGDGNTSIFATPSHTYTTAGTYTVELVVTENGTTTTTETKMDYITVNSPTVVDSDSTIWTGATDRKWATATNWSNGVPDATTAVTIPATGITNFPTLTAATTVASVELKQGATIHGVENLTVTGEFTTSLHVKWYDEYHYLSSPVGEIAIADAFPNDSVGAAFYMYSYDEPTQSWVSKERSENMENGIGYSVYRDAGTGNDYDITFTKTAPVWNDVTFTNLSYTSYDGNPDYESWHLLGNPFPAGLDWEYVSLTNINNAVHCWDGDAGNYVDYNGDLGGINDGIIGVGQAFMIKVEDASNAITLPASATTHSSKMVYKSPVHALRLNVTSTSTSYSDATFVRIEEDATTAYDNAYDAEKLFGLSEAPQLYTQINEEAYSINAVNEATEAIALNFRAGVNGEYTIVASEMINNADVTLEDLLTGEMLEMNADTRYTFTAHTNDDESRFVLHIKNSNAVK